MNVKAFFVAALSSALDLGIAVPDDVVRHVTPDVLAHYLPRPLWARLLTACVGAPHVDAQLVVETIGVPNLCEHVPAHIIWACIDDLGKRSLGGAVLAPAPASLSRPTPAGPGAAPSLVAAATGSRPMPLATPPPPPAAEPKAPEPRPVAVGPSIPSPQDDTETRRAAADRRFRPSNTSMGRLATNAGTQRRPQAQATTPPASEPGYERDRNGDRAMDRNGERAVDRNGERAADRPIDRNASAGDRNASATGRPRRGQTEADYDLETFVGGKDDWKTSLAVEDEQLVDWSSSDETVAGDELGRKR